MQSDGNLVLRAPGNIPLGDTHTAGHDGTIAVMQTDGNFVLRAPGNIPVWASGTDGHPGTVLQVQDDGGVVLYAPGHQVLRVIFPASPGPQIAHPPLRCPRQRPPRPQRPPRILTRSTPRTGRLATYTVHSLGDASLRDNLDCRHDVPGFPTGHAATKDQEQVCATYLVNKVLTTAKSHGLKWVILSEHGVSMGIYAPGANASALSYSRSEAAREWQTVRDTASAAAPTAGVRALIGEEIGSAPPSTRSGHFSTYYSPDYVPNDQYDNSEGKFLQKAKTAGAWGAINHPGTGGSKWGCWFTTDQQPIYRLGIRVGTTCPDGVAKQLPRPGEGRRGIHGRRRANRERADPLGRPARPRSKGRGRRWRGHPHCQAVQRRRLPHLADPPAADRKHRRPRHRRARPNLRAGQQHHSRQRVRRQRCRRSRPRSARLRDHTGKQRTRRRYRHRREGPDVRQLPAHTARPATRSRSPGIRHRRRP